MNLLTKFHIFTVRIYCRVRYFFEVKSKPYFKNKDRWNKACDYVINAQIMNDHEEFGDIALPKNALYNPEWKYLTAEQIYNKLKDD